MIQILLLHASFDHFGKDSFIYVHEFALQIFTEYCENYGARYGELLGVAE